jgi:hypothetical protein
MSLINPGPKSRISVVYQNVQGLIPFSELHSETPMLHESQMSEFQAVAYMKKPDILILNETWLKGTIHDNEILHPDA